MKREILVNATARETRVAILEDDLLVELMVDRPDAARMVGDVYKGRVEAVLPGIQAAFVDIGTEKAAFLHVSDVAVEDDGDDDDDAPEPDEGAEKAASNGGGGGGGGGRRRDYPPIQDVLKKGQDLVVQVSKEPISTKGPRVTAQISLPGRFLVYMPGSSHVGVSRKIEDREERARLRALAREVLPEKSGGVIVRTVSEDLTRETFERELKSLMSTWQQIQKKAKRARAPAPVHREAKLTAGIIRDLFSQKVDSLTVDSKLVFDEIVAYLEQVDPTLVQRVHLYGDAKPLFDAYDLEREIRDAFQRRVNLAVRRLHHRRAHRGAGLHRRQHGALHGQEGPRKDDPQDQRGRGARRSRGSCGCATSAASSSATSSTWSPRPTATRCCRSCGSTCRATGRAPRRSR